VESRRACSRYEAIVGRWFTEFWGKDFNPPVSAGVAGAISMTSVNMQVFF